MKKEEAYDLFQTRPMMECGCVAMAVGKPAHSEEYYPACITHNCMTLAAKQPTFEGRTARCFYYGKPVKGGMYNSNCCAKCKVGTNCSCEEPSSPKLWFFVSNPGKSHDEFYCACHGAD